MKKFYLYKLENSVNGKCYLGITSNPKRRFREHMNPKSSCKKLARAISKYGEACFSMEILCIGEEGYILDMERKAIVAFDSIDKGYNILAGHPNELGFTMPDSVRKRVSESLKAFYKENPDYLKNNRKPRKLKHSGVPEYMSGFWFPDIYIGMQTLGMNEKSYYKRKAEGTLGDSFHLNKKSVSFNSVYVLGFWFPTLNDAAWSCDKDKLFLQHLVRKGDVEECLRVVGTRPRKEDSPKSIGVSLRENGRFRCKMIHNKETVFDKTFLDEISAAIYYDNRYEEIYGDRPNKTIVDKFP